MNRLILLRHGKAERGSASGEDFERELVGRGASEAASTAYALKAQGFVPDVALVSSAARTRQTWAAAAPTFPRAEARFVEQLYHADAATIRRVVDEARVPGAVMVVGHNPGLHELVIRLVAEQGDDPELMFRARRGFPTSAAAVFAFDGDGRPRCETLIMRKDGWD
jgi:phosphohistidine phosphatase